MKLQVFMAVNIESTMFWGVMPCSFVAGRFMTVYQTAWCHIPENKESLDSGLLECDAVSLAEW